MDQYLISIYCYAHTNFYFLASLQKLKAEVLLNSLHLLHSKNQTWREYSVLFSYSTDGAVN